MKGRRKGIRAACAALLAAVLAAACDERPAGYAFRSTPVDGWERNDVLAFPVDTVRRGGDYRIDVCVRASSARSYPFRTLWLVVGQEWKNPSAVRQDTLVCPLANADGDLNGRGVSLFQYDFPLDTVTLAPGSSGQIVVRHIMRRDILLGISDIGVKVTPL